MSNYNFKAKHKETGKIKNVEAIDDYYKRHRYGYRLEGTTTILDFDELTAFYEIVEDHVQSKECGQKPCDATTEDMKRYKQPSPKPRQISKQRYETLSK